MTPTDKEVHSSTLEETRHELREGIETSREIVRQSRMLIAFSECHGAAANENEDRGIAS